ncbi:hypothetical protein [Parapedobacter sp. 2B3]|uniref:dCTP deaminase domain-containing protein n=1 Tax=Parapedobacter sp. 2B3 TaxID=3342381 RepID=UPI0035B69316
MAIVDLKNRITNDLSRYNKSKLSSQSLIYIDQGSYKLDDGPASVDLSVGDKWFFVNENTAYDVADGVEINPFQSILIETKEHIRMPLNVFGLVTGKGRHIFQGAFISTGKIDPSFDNKLKIGIYNGSKKKIKLVKDAPLCTCVFFEMETNLPYENKRSNDAAPVSPKPIGRKKRFLVWVKENKELIAIFISLIALIGTLLNVFLKID